LEQRGFESLWLPEHTHIPASRKTPYPAGGDLPKEYWHSYLSAQNRNHFAPAKRRLSHGLSTKHKSIVPHFA
jgi:hypothetical protein